MVDAEKLLFRLSQDDDGWPPYEVEGVWCYPRGSDYVVGNLPFFVRGLAFEDTVRVEKDHHGDVTSFEMLEPAPYSVIWVLFPADDPDVSKLGDALRALGCEVEGFHVEGQWWLLSVAVPVGIALREIDALLEPYVAPAEPRRWTPVFGTKVSATRRRCPLPTDTVEEVGCRIGVGARLSESATLLRLARAAASGSAWPACGGSGRWQRGGTRPSLRWGLGDAGDPASGCA